MYKKTIYICLIFNILLLIASGINYKIIVLPSNDDIDQKIDEQTASIAIKSSKIIQAYSEQEKIDNIDRIIFLYGKIAAYLDPLEKYMFEANEVMSYYSYILIAISVINIALVSIVLKQSSMY